jgi:gliding motility-associated-like protein
MTSGACTRTDTVLVTVIPTIAILISQPNPFCPGGDATLGLLNANLFKDIVWAPKDALLCGECKDKVSAQTVKLYTSTGITVTGKNKQGDCPATGSVSVVVFPIPEIHDPSSNLICKAGTTIVELNQNPIVNQTYVWNIANQSTIPNPKVRPTSDSTYTVTATTTNNCKETKSFTIRVADSQLKITGDSTSCIGGFVKLKAEPVNGINLGTPTYKWSNGDDKQEITPTILQNGTFSVTMTYGNGCTVVASQNVKVVPTTATVSILEDKACIGIDKILTAVPSSGASNPTYNWSAGTSNGASTTISNFPASGSYSVTMTYGNGCTTSATKTITGVADFKITLTKKPDTSTVLIGSSPIVTVTTTGNNPNPMYSWTLNNTPLTNTTNSISEKLVASDNIITVVVKSPTVAPEGCPDKTLTINYKTEKPIWVMPNAFTPNNGDTINDKFKIVFKNKIVANIASFKVFDRFGTEVFSALDNSGWNGKYNDSDAPADTYMYIVKVLANGVEVKSENDTDSGSITLIR